MRGHLAGQWRDYNSLFHFILKKQEKWHTIVSRVNTHHLYRIKSIRNKDHLKNIYLLYSSVSFHKILQSASTPFYKIPQFIGPGSTVLTVNLALTL